MTETGNPPTVEDTAALRAQLAEAHEELERRRQEAGEAEEAAERLREQLAEATGARFASDAEAQAAREYASAAEARLRTAAEKYRDLVVRTEPELPQELVAGDDIDAIDASIESARRIVGQVRAQLEISSQPLRVPAGSPARSAPDYSALPAEEKIRIGLAQRDR